MNPVEALDGLHQKAGANFSFYDRLAVVEKYSIGIEQELKYLQKRCLWNAPMSCANSCAWPRTNVRSNECLLQPRDSSQIPLPAWSSR